MRTPGDAAAVTAAQRGEPGALDALVAAYLPLVYNVVGHALAGHRTRTTWSRRPCSAR
jgi:hypothetical protein